MESKVVVKLMEANQKGNEDEYNKGLFAAANAYDSSHIYLLYIHYGKSKEL